MRLILYSKPECSLCDTLKADLLSMQATFGFALVERNIEENPDDFGRFRYLIPVLEINDAELLYPPHTWHSVFQALQATQDQEQTAG